jgi:uncharacterized membrane protein YjjP (DUF1212 family)
MENESSATDVRALWQNQPVSGGSMSTADVRRKFLEIQQTVRRRKVVLFAAGALNAGLPLMLMWFLPSLRLGLAYLTLTALVLITFVHRRSKFQTIAPDMTAAQGLAFYRGLLARERDFRRASTRWFTIGPALNIVVLALVYMMSPLFHGTASEVSIIAAILTTHAIVLTRIAQRLQREAHSYQIELDRLSDPLA